MPFVAIFYALESSSYERDLSRKHEKYRNRILAKVGIIIRWNVTSAVEEGLALSASMEFFFHW